MEYERKKCAQTIYVKITLDNPAEFKEPHTKQPLLQRKYTMPAALSYVGIYNPCVV